MLRSLPSVLTLICLFALNASSTLAQDATPRILERSAHTLPEYSQLPEQSRAFVSESGYERLRSDAEHRREQIVYSSDGLRVHGFIDAPTAASGEKRPVLVFCRGGVGEGAAIGPGNLFALLEMRRYAQAGFIVVAPQYRGIGGGEGRDEVGGDDVRDVLNLLPIIRALPNADASRVGLVGGSRGGMMVLQALRGGFPAQAAAVIGAPTDWEIAFAHSASLKTVAERFWPDYKDQPARAIERRSAARWVDELNTPLLLIHGGDDTRVHPAVILDFAQKLSARGKLYELLVYAGDDHGVSQHFAERIERTVAWLRSPPQRSAASASAAPPSAASAKPIPVVARDYRLEMPERIASGRVTFAFENGGVEPHYFRLLRIEGERTIDDFVAWRKERRGLPEWLKAAGGGATVGAGERAEYTTDLPPGRYIAFCGHPSPDGVPHVDRGMHTLFVAEPRAATEAIVAAVGDVTLHDDRIESTLSPRPGSFTVRVRNAGAQTHQAMLVLLPQSVKVEDELAWFRNGSRGVRPGKPMGGVIELAAGAEAWVGVHLRPGRYVWICSGANADGARHFDAGMLQAFEVKS